MAVWPVVVSISPTNPRPRGSGFIRVLGVSLFSTDRAE